MSELIPAVLEQTEIAIFGSSRLGMYLPNSNMHLYELKDHLGNVRATLSKDAQGMV